MENDVNNDIEYVVECIQKYMDGNEEYYEVVDIVIEALNQFKKLHTSNTLKTRIIFLISKLATFIKCPGLFKDRQYQETIQCFEEDISFYLETKDKLNKYIETGIKTNHYPNLDMAYILYLRLSFLFREIISYSRYIRTLENSFVNGYYFDKKARSESIIAEKEDIKRLLLLTGIEKED